MGEMETSGIITIIAIIGIFAGLYKITKGISQNQNIFDFERDHKQAINKSSYRSDKKMIEKVYIGKSTNKKNVFIPSDAKHVFVCGTTGSGKTVALSNFIKAGADYDYPMLIVDGKGDTDKGSLLDIVKILLLSSEISTTYHK